MKTYTILYRFGGYTEMIANNIIEAINKASVINGTKIEDVISVHENIKSE